MICARLPLALALVSCWRPLARQKFGQLGKKVRTKRFSTPPFGGKKTACEFFPPPKNLLEVRAEEAGKQEL